MPRPFLTARWTHLCLISYRVPRGLLEPHVPRGLELDTPPGTPAEMGVVSLVAFDFEDTRVMGVHWPGHVNFPEANLRFYVRFPGTGGAERGVVFIRELVPRALVSFIARLVYNEPYLTVKMASRVARESDRLAVEHRVNAGGAKESLIRVIAGKSASVPPETSPEHWFKEQKWGFGRSRSGKTVVYEVRHPVWRTFPVERLDLDFDWVGLYGPEWGFLQSAPPISVTLAEGSPVEVYPKRSLKEVEAPSASATPGA